MGGGQEGGGENGSENAGFKETAEEDGEGYRTDREGRTINACGVAVALNGRDPRWCYGA